MSSQSSYPTKALRQLFSYLSGRRRRQLGALFALMLASSAAELLTIAAALPFLGMLAGQAPRAESRGIQVLSEYVGVDRLAITAALLVIMFVAASALRLLLAWSLSQLGFRLGSDLSIMVYERTLYQPYRAHLEQNSSEVQAGIYKVQGLVSQLIIPILTGLTSTVVAAGILSVLFFVSAPVAAAAALVVTPAYLLVALLARRSLQRNGIVIARAQTQGVKAVSEGLGGIRDVIIQDLQPLYVEVFSRSDRALRHAQASNVFASLCPRYALEAGGMVLIAGLALVLSRQSGGLAGAVPIVGAFALGAMRLLPLAQQIFNAWAQARGSAPLMWDVLMLLSRGEPPQALDASPANRQAMLDGIMLQDVGFRYAPDGPFVLRKVQLNIPKGARIGFVGRTGSGKTTLIDLIMGLLEPSEGVITVDGRPLDATLMRQWRQQIGHVPQQVYLVDGSVMDNIAFGVQKESIDEARVCAAAHQASIGEFIETLADRYHTRVGERGIRLSGGQRQRIAIARALYRRAEVLVFDEATSALDDTTESEIMDAIEGMERSLTILMVAHRPTTLQSCDYIYRVERGRLIEVRGFHNDR